MSKFSQTNFFQSFGCAIRGIKLAIKSQKNIKRQIVVAILVIISALLYLFYHLITRKINRTLYIKFNDYLYENIKKNTIESDRFRDGIVFISVFAVLGRAIFTGFSGK